MIKLKSKTGMRTCGKCGTTAPAGEAHNARTCGKTVIPKQTPTPHLKTSPEQPQGGRVEWGGLMEKVNNVEKTDNDVHHTEKGKELYDTDNNYTVAELKTLWELMNGNKGKRGRGKTIYGANAVWKDNDTKQLMAFVEDIHAACPDLPAHTWGVFFKTLGARAKLSLACKHVSCVMTPNTLEEKIAPPLQLGATFRLPPQLLQAFSEDSSKNLQRTIATREGLPEHVKNAMCNNTDPVVLKNLAARMDSSPELLQKIYTAALREIKNAENLPSSNATFEKQLEYHYVLSKIGKHPATPKRIVLELSHSVSSTVRESVYSNENFPLEQKHELYNKLREKHRRNEQRKKELTSLPAHIYNQWETQRDIRRIQSDNETIQREMTKLTIAGGNPNREEVLRITEEEIEFMLESLKKDEAAGYTLSGWAPVTLSKLLTHNQYTKNDIEKFYDKAGGVRKATTAFTAFLLLQSNTPQHIVKACQEYAKNVNDLPRIYIQALKVAETRTAS